VDAAIDGPRPRGSETLRCPPSPSLEDGVSDETGENASPNRRRHVPSGWRHVACARRPASDRAASWGVVPVAYPSSPPCALHLQGVRLYCTHPAGLTDVRLETFLINSAWTPCRGYDTGKNS